MSGLQPFFTKEVTPIHEKRKPRSITYPCESPENRLRERIFTSFMLPVLFNRFTFESGMDAFVDVERCVKSVVLTSYETSASM